MAELGNPLSSPFPLAIYSLSLRLAEKAAYWDPSVIPEDWHMYFRCMFADQGKVSCSRLMVTVGTEAVEGSGYLDTLKECYQQSVRWQWGAVDVGYLLVQSVSKSDVPLLKRIGLIATAYDHHMLVVVMCLALMSAPWLYGSIPVMVDLDFITGNQNMVALQDLMIYTWAFHFLFHYAFLWYSMLREMLLIPLADELHMTALAHDCCCITRRALVPQLRRPRPPHHHSQGPDVFRRGCAGAPLARRLATIHEPAALPRGRFLAVHSADSPRTHQDVFHG